MKRWIGASLCLFTLGLSPALAQPPAPAQPNPYFLKKQPPATTQPPAPAQPNPYFLKKQPPAAAQPPAAQPPQVAQPPAGEKPNLYFLKKRQPAKKKGNVYLTKDLKLSAPLQIRDEKKRYGTFWGVIWQIQPDGTWSSSTVYLNQPKLRGKGKLTQAQLKLLAKALSNADVMNLPNIGPPFINPHVITVAYGSHVSFLTFGVDLKLTPVNPNQQGADNLGRYSAILTAVRGLLEPQLPPLNPPERAGE